MYIKNNNVYVRVLISFTRDSTHRIETTQRLEDLTCLDAYLATARNAFPLREKQPCKPRSHPPATNKEASCRSCMADSDAFTRTARPEWSHEACLDLFPPLLEAQNACLSTRPQTGPVRSARPGVSALHRSCSLLGLRFASPQACQPPQQTRPIDGRLHVRAPTSRPRNIRDVLMQRPSDALSRHFQSGEMG